MKADWTIISHYITESFSSWKVGRICIMSLGLKGLSSYVTFLLIIVIVYCVTCLLIIVFANCVTCLFVIVCVLRYLLVNNCFWIVLPACNNCAWILRYLLQLLLASLIWHSLVLNNAVQQVSERPLRCNAAHFFAILFCNTLTVRHWRRLIWPSSELKE